MRVSHRGSPCHFSRFVIYQFFFLSKLSNSLCQIGLFCPKCSILPKMSKLFKKSKLSKVVQSVKIVQSCPNCLVLSTLSNSIQIVQIVQFCLTNTKRPILISIQNFLCRNCSRLHIEDFNLVFTLTF